MKFVAGIEVGPDNCMDDEKTQFELSEPDFLELLVKYEPALRILWLDVTLGLARTIIHREQERQLEQALIRVPFRRNAEECRRVNLTTRTFRSLALRS